MGRNQSMYNSENVKLYNIEVSNGIMDRCLSCCVSGENNSFFVEKINKIYSSNKNILISEKLPLFIKKCRLL